MIFFHAGFWRSSKSLNVAGSVWEEDQERNILHFLPDPRRKSNLFRKALRKAELIRAGQGLDGRMEAMRPGADRPLREASC